MAKVIEVSTDDVTYHTLPGNTGELRNDGAEIDDSIFGANFRSNFPGLINWGVGAQAFFKGFAGYSVNILQVGTPAAFTAEAMTLVSGKTFQIDDVTKRIWDRSEATMDILDNAVSVADADILNIDFLYGRVTFVSSYSPTTPITATGKSFPTAAVGKGQNYTLTQTADPIETTDFETAQANTGRRTFSYGLKTVNLEIQGVYDATNAFIVALQNRSELIMEIDPAGDTLSRARGFFRLVGQNQSGDVGALEEETVNFSLSVPDNTPDAEVPFKWEHAGATTLNLGVKALLDMWEAETNIYVRYLSDGTNGWEGQGVVTDITVGAGLETMNEFNVDIQGTGALTAFP